MLQIFCDGPYNHKNQLISAEEFDEDPNPTADLLSKAEYKYDVFNNRIEKTVDEDGDGTVDKTERYAYDGWKKTGSQAIGNENWDVLFDLDATGSLTTRYIRGDAVDEVFAHINTAGAFWLLPDHLGSIRDVANASGTVVERLGYDGFGNINSIKDGNGNLIADAEYIGRYRFTGREFDVESGLQYSRARYYDATIGRWINQDPIGFDAGDSNLYRYVNNRPTVATDPSGLDERPTSDGSNLQWISNAKMNDLVGNKLAHAVQAYKPHRVIIMPYGNEIRAFDYQQDVNPAKGGSREWAYVRSYSLGPISDESALPGMLQNVDTAATAERLAKASDDDRRVGAQLAGLQAVIVGINMLPGGASADAIDKGRYVDAAISFVGDVALFGSSLARGTAMAAAARSGAKAAATLANANRAILRFRATELAIAVTRTGQAGYAVLQQENGQAAAYLGEALLRILGVAYSRTVAPRGGVGGFASAGADLPNNPFLRNAARMTPERGYFDLAAHSFNGGTQLLGAVERGVPTGLGLVEVERLLISNGWRGEPIRLVSCQAGSSAAGSQAFANQLSQYLRVPVMAPASDITVFANGSYVIRAGDATVGQASIQNPWVVFGQDFAK